MLSKENIDWIQGHIQCKVDELALRIKNKDDEAVKCLMQIKCRQHTARKLRHTLSNVAFEFPSAISAEQSTSDDLADFHSSLISPGDNVCDITAGLGIDVLHFAQKASSVTAIEMNSLHSAILSDNIKVLGINNVEVINGDSRDILPTLPRYDVIFADPARRDDAGGRVYSVEMCTPNILELLPVLKSHSRKAIIKLSPMIDITDTLRRFSPYIRDIYAVGTDSECKEIVAILDFDNDTDSSPTISAVTIFPDGSHKTFSYLYGDEYSPIRCGDISPEDILVEPFPAIMKIAPWKALSNDNSLSAIAPNSHIFFSSLPHPEIGKSYKVTAVFPYSSSLIKRFPAICREASVAVRNFPLKAEELRRKLKLKESSVIKLFGTTDKSGNKILIICRKLTPNPAV